MDRDPPPAPPRVATEAEPGTEIAPEIDIDSPQVLVNRDLSWLGFARRVLALVQNGDLPILERVKFAGIMGMLHDEFFMKRVSGMKHGVEAGQRTRSPDGMLPEEELQAARAEVLRQIEILSTQIDDHIRPALEKGGWPIRDWDDLRPAQREALRRTFQETIQPILTPLAVDAEHPFPFISNHGLNLAVLLPDPPSGRDRFVRIKVPDNRPRWVPLPEENGWVPLEQVIAANLDLMFPGSTRRRIYAFRVSRGAEGHPERGLDLTVDEALAEPGLIVRVVSEELKARRFAGCVRLQVDHRMPTDVRDWLAKRLGLGRDDVFAQDFLLGVSDLLKLNPTDVEPLRFPRYEPVTHPRLSGLDPKDTSAIFREIARGDVLLHHPYHSFDTSVLRFLQSAASDPKTLGIKLTIYRTSSDSPIMQALVDASRRGKQVAVLVEITARFDEAPNIAWGKHLEEEGVHVAYGVERLKTHVKLALVVREEQGRIRRYAHVGTGNYHTGTARIYEDLGLLTADPDICDDVSAVFNALTGSTPHAQYRRLLVAPTFLRSRFTELIRREAEHAKAGRPSGILAKMNQLEDPDLVRELYRAGRAGVPITLIVRGLNRLRPGVPGLSENIRVFSVVGRYLEHSRIYRFENAGHPEFFLGSADWMRRNLDHRVETITPVPEAVNQAEIQEILDVYLADNYAAWDCQADGTYVKRRPAAGEERREAQEVFQRRAIAEAAGGV